MSHDVTDEDVVNAIDQLDTDELLELLDESGHLDHLTDEDVADAVYQLDVDRWLDEMGDLEEWWNELIERDWHKGDMGFLDVFVKARIMRLDVLNNIRYELLRSTMPLYMIQMVWRYVEKRQYQHMKEFGHNFFL